MRRVRWEVPVMVLAAVFSLTTAAAEAAPTRLSVVAAEDFWGSIARQLGGERAEVTSLIADPDTEAHDYEPKPSDGAAVAQAQVAIVNGIGYDGWMSDLLAANRSSSRKVVNVGDVVGAKEGENPHQWYSPRSVNAAIDAITDALKQASPDDAGYFDGQRQAYRTEALKRYNELRAQIKERYSGAPVGASESIFAPLAEDLGLKLLTPESFIEAVSEGDEPTAKDKATVDKQLTGGQIKVFVHNAQNSTPDVVALVDKAKKAGVPLVAVTETPLPKGASFQDWQATQLQSLADALAATVGGTAPSGSTAQVQAAPSTGAPARSGASTRWLVLLAGVTFVLGGLVAGRVLATRRRSPLRGT